MSDLFGNHIACFPTRWRILLQVLCIHLKRFRHEFYSSKISTYVAFPLDNLDMGPYLHKGNNAEMMLGTKSVHVKCFEFPTIFYNTNLS